MGKSKAETLQLDRKIWDLRLAGLGTTQIAAALGLTPQQLSKRLAVVKKQIQPEVQESAMAHVALTYARLERLIRAHWPAAIGSPSIGTPGTPGFIAGTPPSTEATTLIASLMRDQGALFKLSVGGGKTLPAPSNSEAEREASDEESNADAARDTLFDRITRVIEARRAQASNPEPKSS